MSAVSVQSFAKINLFLAVHDAQPSGFHDIDTVFHSVGLFDRLSLSVGAGTSSGDSHGTIEVVLGHETEKSIGSALPVGADNIAFSAVESYLARNPDARGVFGGASIQVELSKSIPMGAGLAGGSSNAAGVLAGLEHIVLERGGNALGDETVSELCEDLGSDVPFCYVGGCMEGAGRGEQLSPLPALPSCHIVIMVPEVSISTADAYRWIDEARASIDGSVEAGASGAGIAAMREALDTGDLRSICAALHNDFEQVVYPRYPVVAELRDAAIRTGAAGALLSGSGSAVFAICDDIGTAWQISAEVTGSQIAATAYVVDPSDSGWKI